MHVVQGLKKALEAMFVQSMGPDDLLEIFAILDIEESDEVDEQLFAAIAGFSERVLCPRMASYV